MLKLVEADTKAFNQVMIAFGLPKSSEQEKADRSKAIQDATKFAIDIPCNVMESAYGVMEVIRAMAETGNPNSVSDAGVAALCARSAVMGAYLNVRINAKDFDDKNFVSHVITNGNEIQSKTIALETEILKIVDEKIRL